MKIMFLCPKCQKKLEADGEASGQKVKCPTCGQAMKVPKRDLQPGVTLGGFRIVRKLGEGGMGEVFLARQKSLDRDVALKVLPPQLGRDKELVARFFSEVKVLAKLNHPSIVTAHEAGEDGGIYFLAMAYVPGHSLQDQIQKNGAFEEKEALRLIRKMAQALDYAWADHKLLHRDIKPSNVLLDEHEEPKLVDFGLAKTIDQSEGLTMSGTMIGTPNYMSPEQINGEQVLDFRSDLYALGATLYHMLTAKMPYAGSSIVETLHKQMSEPLPDPRTINPRISKGCVMLLQQMLAKKREQRHGSWKAFLGDVDRVLAGHEPTGTALKEGESALLMSGTASTGPSRKMGVLIAAAALLLLAIGVTIWLLMRPAPAVPAAALEPVAPVPNVVAPVQVAAQQAAQEAKAREAAAREAAAKQAVALAAEQEKTALEAKARETAEVAAKEVAAKEAAAKEEAAKAAKLKAAQARFAAGLAEVAGLVEKGDFAQARGKATALQAEPELAPLKAETDALATLMDRAADPDATVLRSFERDKGQTVKVQAKNGMEMEVRVLGVDGGRVQTRQTIQGAMVERSFGPADLSVRERLARIGSEKTPQAAILRGSVLGLEGGDWGKAKQAFAEAGPGLGEELVKRLQAKSDSQEELAARQALGAILKMAALPADLNEAGRVMELLAEKPLTPKIQEKVRTELESFLKTYGRSESAGVAKALAEGVSADPEAAATLELINLLKLAGLKLDLEQPESLAEEVEARGFGKDAAKIRAAATAFNRDHGKSEIGKQAAGLVYALAAAEKEALVPFVPVPMVEATEENITNALVALQAANTKAKGLTNTSYRIGKGQIELSLNNAEHLRDIRPLAGLPLHSLSMAKCEVKNFAALAGMPLVHLGFCQSNMEKIESFPDLKELYDISVLQSSCKSLLPFRRLKLKKLDIRGSMVDKLDGIEGFPLETLWANSCIVEDLSLLAGKPLKCLWIGGRQGAINYDLTPLKDVPLNEFALENANVKDFAPLAGKQITRLDLRNSPISDLTLLANMPLRSVYLSTLNVTDLAPLKGDALWSLTLYNLPVRELKPLAGCPLRELTIRNLPKLIDLQNIPDYFPDLEKLHLDESLAKTELINRLKNLKKLTVYAEPYMQYGKDVPLSTFKK